MTKTKKRQAVLLGVLTIIGSHLGCCVLWPMAVAVFGAGLGAWGDGIAVIIGAFMGVGIFYGLSKYMKTTHCDAHPGHKGHQHIFCSDLRWPTLLMTFLISLAIGWGIHEIVERW